MTERPYEWLRRHRIKVFVMVNVGALAAETAAALTEHGYDVSRDMERWKIREGDRI